jgi:hypothetical protein
MGAPHTISILGAVFLNHNNNHNNSDHNKALDDMLASGGLETSSMEYYCKLKSSGFEAASGISIQQS